jgi:hypothetical protein
MILIEIRSHRWGWKAFEAPGVEPVFPNKDQAIDSAQNRACFRSGEIQILDSTGNVEMSLNMFLKKHRKGQEQDRKMEQQDAMITELKIAIVRQRKEIAAPTSQIQRVSIELEARKFSRQIVLNNR